MAKAFRHTYNEQDCKFDLIVESYINSVFIKMTNKPTFMLTFKEAVILHNVLSEWLVQV